MKGILIIFLLSGGLFFFAVGTLGLLRLPDVLGRAHSAAKCDTLGAVMTLAAAMVYSGWNATTLKILLMILFIWITNPTATHLIGRVVYLKNAKSDNGVRKNEDL
ncbi:monovalent cation/H(+) antiporter subunit G [Anaerosolibacter sp.]|jgi:multicomponent Na+:H+ antiporter subunit G|uniref:monovalent cation/H(+) antiporter subunit G n=1 Tax=Anaerosolibacter sp. TaxID=1872527 RepID=UPI00260D684F|nr:monovalent cation/H(+) antiporter subunit G [Anaerosolibacter sp.]MDF2546715.1 monovalent cation/H(+) antiporter subunit [Anaerosolibacter sp.]